MALFFRKGKRSPKQICANLRNMVLCPGKSSKGSGGNDEDDAPLNKRLEALKNALCLDEKYKVEEKNEIGKYLIETDGADRRVPLYLVLVEHLSALEFESQKNVASTINAMVVHNLGNFTGTLLQNDCYALKALIEALVRAHSDYAIIAGAMLRDVLTIREAAKFFLNHTELMQPFFEIYLVSEEYDIVSDAFITLRELLCGRHKQLVSSHLESHFDDFFRLFNGLLKSSQYFTKRAALKLLSELLLDRSNFNVMIRFIADPEHLKLVMLLLRENSKKIQLEAFHVFKVFAANPYKSQPVNAILYSNKDKIVAFLKTLAKKDASDEHFNEECDLLIRKLTQIGPEPEKPPAKTSGD